MEAMDAVALGARVQQVADKLLQKAQEARTRGNAGAAQSLTESVNDLRHAASVLVEQKRLLTVRQATESSQQQHANATDGDGAPRARLRRNSSASSIVSMLSTYEVGSVYNGGGSVAGSIHHQQHQDLVSKLMRVEKMLGKKSDEMKVKGNESASNALQQSASYVRSGCGFIAEQQHKLSALMSTQEKLQTQWYALSEVLSREGDGKGQVGGEESGGGLVDKVAAIVTELAELKGFLKNAFPGCSDSTDVNELADRLQRERAAAKVVNARKEGDAVKMLEAERDHLQKQLAEAKKIHAEEYLIAREDIEILKSENGALEKQMRVMEIQHHERSERELAELHSLYAAEKESHVELERVLVAKSNELETLVAQVDAWKNKFDEEQQKRKDCMDEHQKHCSEQDKWVTLLQNDLKSREEAIAALEMTLREKDRLSATPSADGKNDVHDFNVSPNDESASKREIALRELQADKLELQTRLTDCQTRLESETAQRAEVIRERDELEARIFEIESLRESELVALSNSSDSKVAEVERKYLAKEQEAKNLAEKVEQLTSDVGMREQISGELKAAAEGYREACAKLRKDVEDREITISRLEADLQNEHEVADGSQRELETDLAALKSDILEISKCLESSANVSPDAVVESLGALSLQKSGALRDAFVVQMGRYGVVRKEFDQLLVEEQQLREVVDGFVNICASYFERAPDSGEEPSERLNRVKLSIASALDEIKSLKKALGEKADAERSVQHKQEELLEFQHKYASSTDAVHRLEQQVAALEKERSELASEIREHKSKSMDETGREEARAKQTEELQQRLKDVESEFERYRTRSHTALKKVEKRAELLNGMRKENEQLKQKLEASVLQCQHALESERRSTESLHEARRTQDMMQEEFQQRLSGVSNKLAQTESQLLQHVGEQQRKQREFEELSETVEKLVQEKRELADFKNQFFEQEKEARETELATLTFKLQEKEDAVLALTEEIQEKQTQIQSQATELEHRTGECESLEAKLRESEQEKLELESELLSARIAEPSEGDETMKLQSENAIAALESQTRQLEIELAASEEEIRRLSRTIEEKSAEQDSSATAASTESPMHEVLSQREAEISRLQDEKESLDAKQKEQHERIAHLLSQVSASELRVALLEDQIESLQSRDDQDTARDQQSSSIQKLDSAKDELIKDLRHQVLDLQEQLQVFEEARAARELEKERGELVELQATRLELQKKNEHAMKLKQRKAVVVSFKQHLSAVVEELQRGLDEHSAAFRDACEYRDGHRSKIVETAENQDPNADPAHAEATSSAESTTPAGNPTSQKIDEFEEYLVMHSGVVIKAGASFQLPVFCEKKGWRVVWTFTVKEDSADVGFALVEQRGQAILAPHRVNALSGIYNVGDDATTLVFEWDNSFSWLNEKTLDYHVSIQEPLSPAKQQLKAQERSLQHTSKQIREGIAILATEADRRAALKHAAEHLSQSEQEKDTYLQQFVARKDEILKQKADLQLQMEELKSALSAMFSEQDEIEEDTKTLLNAWDGAIAEQEDAETTIRLAESSQLEILAQQLEEQVQGLEKELLSFQDRPPAAS